MQQFDDNLFFEAVVRCESIPAFSPAEIDDVYIEKRQSAFLYNRPDSKLVEGRPHMVKKFQFPYTQNSKFCGEYLDLTVHVRCIDSEKAQIYFEKEGERVDIPASFALLDETTGEEISADLNTFLVQYNRDYQLNCNNRPVFTLKHEHVQTLTLF